jgi:hypothetical protein
MCCEPGDDATAAKTVLVPMSEVEKRLPPGHIDVLSRTKYRINDRCHTIVRVVDGRHVFAFRDFLAGALEWRCADDALQADEVNTILRDLLAAMYAPGVATGVCWRRGMLVIIDNSFFFHGRTAASAGSSTRQRHLKRLRIL